MNKAFIDIKQALRGQNEKHDVLERLHQIH